MVDNINSPSHYTQGNIEVIVFILDQKMNYLQEDLKKARWYIDKLIEEETKNGK